MEVKYLDLVMEYEHCQRKCRSSIHYQILWHKEKFRLKAVPTRYLDHSAGSILPVHLVPKTCSLCNLHCVIVMYVSVRAHMRCDGALGGPLEDMTHDIYAVQYSAGNLVFQLNRSNKSEIIFRKHSTMIAPSIPQPLPSQPRIGHPRFQSPIARKKEAALP